MPETKGCDVVAMIRTTQTRKRKRMNLKTLGGRIRTARENESLTLDDVHRMSGLSKGFLSDIENDKRNPSSDSVLTLSDTLKVSVEWLLRGRRSQKAMKCPMCNGRGNL